MSADISVNRTLTPLRGASAGYLGRLDGDNNIGSKEGGVMVSRSITFGVAVAAVFLAAPLAYAQSIYKCPQHGGGYEFTDTPCTGPGATVVHKATAGEVAAKLNADDRQAMASMLRSGQVAAAKQYATAHHQEALYNSIVVSLVQEQAAAEQRRQQEAEIARQRQAQAVNNQLDSLSAQNQQLQEQVSAQSQELEFQRQRAARANQRARSAQDAAMRAQQEAQTPKFNPQTGQWCQQIGGTVQCN